MKRIKNIITFLTLLFSTVFAAGTVYADELATVTVHTAKVIDNETIEVSVYISGVSSLGGIDASLIYNPDKAEYISSNISEAYQSQFGETNHIAEENIVKCVAVYQEAMSANDELFTVTFKMKDNTSEVYQPQLEIADLVDASLEIKDIPYQIKYQQSDGSEGDTPDESGKAAEKEIQEGIPESVKQADAQSADGKGRTDGKDKKVTEKQKTEQQENKKSDNLQSGEKKEGIQEEKDNKDNAVNTENDRSSDNKETETSEKNSHEKVENTEMKSNVNEKSYKVIIGIVFFLLIVFYIIWRKKRTR